MATEQESDLEELNQDITRYEELLKKMKQVVPLLPFSLDFALTRVALYAALYYLFLVIFIFFFYVTNNVSNFRRSLATLALLYLPLLAWYYKLTAMYHYCVMFLIAIRDFKYFVHQLRLRYATNLRECDYDGVEGVVTDELLRAKVGGLGCRVNGVISDVKEIGRDGGIKRLQAAGVDVRIVGVAVFCAFVFQVVAAVVWCKDRSVAFSDLIMFWK